jgi:hypothetical protein
VALHLYWDRGNDCQWRKLVPCVSGANHDSVDLRNNFCKANWISLCHRDSRMAKKKKTNSPALRKLYLTEHFSFQHN